MKIIKQLFTLTAIALLFTACNKIDELAPEQNSTFPADGIIRVSTSVASLQTRAGATTDNLYEFQLLIKNENNSAYSYSAYMRADGMGSNKKWLTNYRTSRWSWEPMTMLWQNKTSKVKVVALSDFEFLPDHSWESGYYLSISNNQKDHSSMRLADILYMKEKDIDPSKDLVGGKIPIVFNHRLSKLNLTLKMGTEFNKFDGGTTDNNITNIRVVGTNTKALWKIIEDELSNFSSPLNITPWFDTLAYMAGEGDTKQAEAKYECILIPQTVATNTFKVSFKIGARDFSWTSSLPVELVADTQYNLTLNVGRDVVTVEGFSSTPWTEVTPENIGTE